MLIAELYRGGQLEDEAAAAYRRAIELSPTSAGPYVALMDILASASRFEAAMEVAQGMVRQPQLTYGCQMSIGALLVAQDRSAEAMAAYQVAAEADPHRPDAFVA